MLNNQKASSLEAESSVIQRKNMDLFRMHHSYLSQKKKVGISCVKYVNFDTVDFLNAC